MFEAVAWSWNSSTGMSIRSILLVFMVTFGSLSYFPSISFDSIFMLLSCCSVAFPTGNWPTCSALYLIGCVWFIMNLFGGLARLIEDGLFSTRCGFYSKSSEFRLSMPSLTICYPSFYVTKGVSSGRLHELQVWGRKGPTKSCLGFNYCSWLASILVYYAAVIGVIYF